MSTAMAYTTRGVISEGSVTSAGDALSSSVDINTDYPPLHCPASRLTATQCVFDLIANTTPALIVRHEPIVNGTVIRRREALRRAKVLSASDPTTLEIASGSYFKDHRAENRVASLEARLAMAKFERHLEPADGRRSRLSGSPQKIFPTWSPDAETLSAVAAAKAAQPGRMGAGPRVTLNEAYSTFRVLDLSEKGITTVDPAFIHFENLIDLDLGRNCLRVLEHLPTGLVSLSCAANKLRGRALDPVTALPSLNSLDLSYNSLDVESMLSTPKFSQKRTDVDQWPDDRLQVSPSVCAGQPSSETFLCRKFPALQHLDLSWNILCDLETTLMSLRPVMETLRHLFLAGNPVSLLPLYRERSLVSSGSGLVVFDDLPVTHEELSAAKNEFEFVEKRVWDILEASKNTDCVGAARGASSRPMGAEGGRLRCLDVIHFGVKLLHLSNLPEIEAPENDAANKDGGGSVASKQSNNEHSMKTLGEVEFVIPGYEGDSTATTVGAFEWKPGVSLPEMRHNHVPAAVEVKGKRKGAVKPAAKARDDASSTITADSCLKEDNCNWGTKSVAVRPSKEMRDGVFFRGLGVLLYALCGEEEVETSEGQPDDRIILNPASPSTGGASRFMSPSFPAEETAHGATPSPHDQQPRVENTSLGPGEDQDCVAGETPGGGVRSSSDHALGGDTGREGSCPRMVHSRRRRRLVGRGEISLSPFLDPEWMHRRSGRCLAGLREDSALEEATERQANSRGGGDPGTGEETDYASTLSASQSMARSHGGGVIHGSCDLVLEEWVAQSSGCFGRHGNEGADTGSNGSDRGRGESEGRKTPTERVDDAAQPLSTVSIQVQVSLNSFEAMLPSAGAGGSDVPRDAGDKQE